MLIWLNQKPVIDNLRRYPQEIVERLAKVLREGAVAVADPRRKDFYDLADGDRSFFIHISPVTGHVWLLATWVARPVTMAAARYAPHFMDRPAGMAHLY